MTTSSKLAEVKVPLLLRALPNWLTWQYEQVEGEKKPRKVPHYANGKKRHGKQGSQNDIDQLCTFDDALEAAMVQNKEGCGLCMLTGEVSALDFDNCYIDGELDPIVEAAVIGTYSEQSPSGKGLRAFVLGDLGDRKTYAKDGQFGLETFSRKGFVTFTGNITEICDLTDCSNTISEPNEDLLRLIHERFPQPVENIGKSDKGNISVSPIIDIDNEDLKECLSYIPADCGYHEWVEVGMALHNHSHGDNFHLWDEWSQTAPDKYTTSEQLYQKWYSFGQSNIEHPITIRSLINKAHKLGCTVKLPIAAINDFEPISDLIRLNASTDITPGSTHYNIRSVSEYLSEVKPTNWLIKGFLPKSTLGVLYGESGSGKSFIALDICASLARGIEWNSLRTRKASILYIVAEGAAGFNNRIRAYCNQQGLDPQDFDMDIISDVTPNLMDSKSVNNLIIDVDARGNYDLIVMDTFAQVTPGANENSGEDMGTALAYCRKISKASGAMVLLIHHSGKDASKGARGWSGVYGASDVVFEVSRFENDRCIKITKQKDGIDGHEVGFGLQTVVLGHDSDGEEISSCVVEYREVSKKPKKLGLGGNQKIVYDALKLFGDDAWIAEKHLIDICVEQIPKTNDGKDRRRFNVKRAIDGGLNIAWEQNENKEIRAIV